MFDGSSIEGWKGINESDMILMPDDHASVLDPFTDETTVNVRCGIVDPIKVTRVALQNAESCAGTLITTNYGIIQTEDK